MLFENFATAISAAAFAAFILFFSILLTTAVGKELTWRAVPLLSVVSSIAAFYFIPIGSLPPFISLEYGAFVAALLLFFSALIHALRVTPPNPIVNYIAFPLIFWSSLAVLSLFVFYSGVPGSLASIGTYSIMPLWELSSRVGRTGMALIALSLLTILPRIPHAIGYSRFSLETISKAVQSLLCASYITAMLLPWNMSTYIYEELGDGQLVQHFAICVDFAFFWIKCIFLWFISYLIRRITDFSISFRAVVLAVAFAVCGLFCVIYETLFVIQ